jgi:hypothetical protein
MAGLAIERREFIKILVALPVVYTLGCEVPKGKAPLLSPDESLQKLIRLLGPWTDQLKADDFIRRFMGTGNTVAPYLPDKGRSLQILASRFSNESIAAEKVNLKDIPGKEKELLLELTQQLYSFIEIRFIVSKEPPWGECQSDNLRYTRPPS